MAKHMRSYCANTGQNLPGWGEVFSLVFSLSEFTETLAYVHSSGKSAGVALGARSCW